MKFTPPDIEDVSEPFCGCRRKHMVLLRDVDPIVASQWCYKKNAGWGPEDFSHASSVKAWWECPFCHREYKSRIGQRTRNQTGCPYCASVKVCEDNALSFLYPEVALEWHPKKNGKLKPSQVTYGSEKAVWWRCRTCEHEWRAVIFTRSAGSGCPACYETRRKLSSENPPPRKRGHIVLSASDESVPRAWYDAGRNKFTPLSVSHPHIAKQWHSTANGTWTPDDFAYGSEALAWWKCENGPDHEWQNFIYKRTRPGGQTCPFCNGMRLSVTNSLATLFPKIAQQWHPALNEKLKPQEVIAGSSQKAWWICPRADDHVWLAIIGDRTRGRGCPFCANKRLSRDNNFKALYPLLAAQWHSTKNNGLKPDEIAPSSKERIWWICSKSPDHEWLATVVSRTSHGTGCPLCNGKQVSTTNSLASLFPEIAREWHPEKNKKLRPEDVTSKSKKVVWWLCPTWKSHSWKDTVYNRTHYKRRCKVCFRSRRA